MHLFLMDTAHRISGYIDILLERASRWRDSGEEILKAMQVQDFTELVSKVEQRQRFIDSYQDCLQRCSQELEHRTLDFENTKILPFLLELTQSDEDFESMQEPLLNLKALLEETRDQERIILRQVSELPGDIRKKLLNVQTQKTGIAAYQKNQSAPLAQFSRFERKK
ncbi:hypothetical protein HOF92_07840 [bacterium]|nr:hypothetical protein [bacterium]